MRLKEIQELVELDPARRGLRFLELGRELKKLGEKPLPIGELPLALRRDSVRESVVAEALSRVHGIAGAVPSKVSGLRETGRRLKTKAGAFADLVLTPRARKSVVADAMTRDRDRSINDLAMRQLALGLFDSSPLARVCSTYAYWQATGNKDAALPILKEAVQSTDEEEKILAAHALRRVSGTRVSGLEGTAEYDKPHSPAQPMKPSMSVIIHGTFARDADWYRPGGDFHTYIQANVFPDLYSDPDFFFWSGRYARDDDGLRGIWTQAATKLISWTQSHPAQTLRLIAHSHGINVVNLATQMGLQSCTLIQLSPPVRTWNLPEIANVSSSRLFNFHSRIDLVVALDGGEQDYRGTAVENAESIRIVTNFGHSDSHEEQSWTRNNLASLVTSVCA
jgi:hypothetical protein